MKGGYLIIDCGGANLGTMTSLPAGTFNKIASCVGKPVLLNNFILGADEPVTGAFGAVGLQGSKYIIEVVADAQLFTLEIASNDTVTATPLPLVAGSLPAATKTKAGVVKKADIAQFSSDVSSLTGSTTVAELASAVELALGDLTTALTSAGIAAN